MVGGLLLFFSFFYVKQTSGYEGKGEEGRRYTTHNERFTRSVPYARERGGWQLRWEEKRCMGHDRAASEPIQNKQQGNPRRRERETTGEERDRETERPSELPHSTACSPRGSYAIATATPTTRAAALMHLCSTHTHTNSNVERPMSSSIQHTTTATGGGHVPG